VIVNRFRVLHLTTARGLDCRRQVLVRMAPLGMLGFSRALSEWACDVSVSQSWAKTMSDT
jgi:hypothetical protein